MAFESGSRLSSVFFIMLIASNFSLFFQPVLLSVISDVNLVDDHLVIGHDSTIEGDFILDGNSTMVFEDCVCEFKGRILVSENSTLILRNMTIRLIEAEGGDGEGFWFHVNGSSRLQVVHVEIETISFQMFSIRISDEARAIFDDVYSLEWYGLVCEGSSQVQISGSVCWSMIEARDESRVSVVDSSIYGVEAVDGSEAYLEDVYTTMAAVGGSGELDIYNSTISSDSEGLSISFCDGTDLALKSFQTVQRGVGYQYCEGWSLKGDNDVYRSSVNVTLRRVYLKIVEFTANRGSQISVSGMENEHVRVVSHADSLDVSRSLLGEVDVMGGSVLSVRSIELAELHAYGDAQAIVDESEIGQLVCVESSRVSLSSSGVGSIETGDSVVVTLVNCSLRESPVVAGDSVVFLLPPSISVNQIEHDRSENLLRCEITRGEGGGDESLTMIIDRDRILKKGDLKLNLDGDDLDFDLRDNADLKYISIEVPRGEWILTILLGPAPPERVPFYLTQVGQQLISFAIIVVLVVLVLLTWK
jgi:hypothetical protein